MNISGLIPIYKERGMTSREVCNKLQSLFHTKHVGHLGTLDPFAEGLLLCFIGEATKLIPYYDDSSKSYRATLKLGIETDTGDCDGVVISTAEVPAFDEDTITLALTKFLGKSRQTIPSTSAKRVNGTHLYEYAHRGVNVNEEYTKEINVYDISLVSFTDDLVIFKTTVSQGTYIRSLGMDIARELGTVGHLIKLVRTHQGVMDIKQAIKLEEVDESKLIPMIDIPIPYQVVNINSDDITYHRVINGNDIPVKTLGVEYDKIMVCHNNTALALYTKCGDTYKCERGLNGH